MIQAIAVLAADVAAAAGGKRILLPLDDVNHIQADDRGRLMDLGPILPDKVSVLCTFTSVCAADESILDEYRRAGITVYPLLGLEAWAMTGSAPRDFPRTWQSRCWSTPTATGSLWPTPCSCSRTGQPLTDAAGRSGREEVMRAATRQALRGLDTGSHVAALKLSVLAATALAICRRLSGDGACRLGCRREGLLVDSHIFVPGDPPWFHDQRRRLLRQQVQDSDLPGYLRDGCARARAIAEAGPGMPADALTQYAEISDELVSLGAADPSVAAVAQLSDSALAVLGAIIELADGDGPGPRQRAGSPVRPGHFPCSGDLSAALAELRGSELAVTASNEYQTVSRPASRIRQKPVLYAYGKIGVRLGRIPFPRIASLVFNGRLRTALGSVRIMPTTASGNRPSGNFPEQ